MNNRFPDRQVFLVQLFAGELDGVVFLAGYCRFPQECPSFALNGGEERGAQETVRRTAFWFGPERQLDDLRTRALRNRLLNACELTIESG